MSSRKKGAKKSGVDFNADVEIDWERIAASLDMPGRGANECKARYEYLKTGQSGKGPWSAEEDEKIVSMVTQFGKFTSSIAGCPTSAL